MNARAREERGKREKSEKKGRRRERERNGDDFMEEGKMWRERK